MKLNKFKNAMCIKNSYFLLMLICIFATHFSVHVAEKSGGFIDTNDLEDLCDACHIYEAEDIADILKNFNEDINGLSQRNRGISKSLSLLQTTPLGYAARRGKADIMELLLQNGAKASIDSLGLLVCHVKGKKFDACFDLLIKHGVDVNGQFLYDEGDVQFTCNGNTPLHVSLPENIKKLVYAGADMGIKNKKEETPLYHHMNQTKEMYNIKELLKYGAPIDEDYENRVGIPKGRPCLCGHSYNYIALSRGEMRKAPSPRVASLVILSFKALGEEVCAVIQDAKLASVINPCLEKYVAWLAEKRVFEVEKYIHGHCPKIGPKPENMAGFVKLVSLYAT